MRLGIKLYLLLSISFVSSSLIAQNKTIDSLKSSLNNVKHDTTKCNILINLIDNIETDSMRLKYNNQLFYIAEKNSKLKNGLQKNYLKYLAYSIDNIAIANQNKGRIIDALYFYFKSLKIAENMQDKSLISISLNNIGSVYESQQDHVKAMDFFKKSLSICRDINDSIGIAAELNNIAALYQNQNNYIKSAEYLNESLKIRELLGERIGIANTTNNLGFNFEQLGDLTNALKCYTKSLNLYENLNNKKGIVISLNNIGGIYLKQKNYNEALLYSIKSNRISKEIGYPENIKNSSLHLKTLYEIKKDYKNALENYELYIQMRDSLYNQENRKASVKSQLKYEYEKKAAADSVKIAEEKKLTSIKLEQEQTQRFFLYGGLGLTALFGLFMFNRFRITQKQKKVIEQQKLIVEHQKQIVDEKQKEILDSIRYAQRIQQSLLPSDKYITRIIKHK